MHDGQLELTAEVVAGLVADQLPQWRDLPITPLVSHGTVHHVFRLGDEYVLRFPLQPTDPEDGYAAVAAEQRAARLLRGRVPVVTPEPVAVGEPGRGFPLAWSVHRWVPGSVAGADVAGSAEFASDLADFVAAVRSIDTAGGRFSGQGRGGRLTDHDDWVRACLGRPTHPFDGGELRDLWGQLRVTPRSEPDVMTHGDLMPGNLLVHGGRLAAVIDVGGLGPADPALDLQPAWNLLAPQARQAFRQRLDVDDDQWDRGRGWAFVQAIGCLDYYRETNPVMSRTAVHTLRAVVEEPRRVGPERSLSPP